MFAETFLVDRMDFKNENKYETKKNPGIGVFK